MRERGREREWEREGEREGGIGRERDWEREGVGEGGRGREGGREWWFYKLQVQDDRSSCLLVNQFYLLFSGISRLQQNKSIEISHHLKTAYAALRTADKLNRTAAELT